jgi:hypothetical protein
MDPVADHTPQFGADAVELAETPAGQWRGQPPQGDLELESARDLQSTGRTTEVKLEHGRLKNMPRVSRANSAKSGDEGGVPCDCSTAALKGTD